LPARNSFLAWGFRTSIAGGNNEVNLLSKAKCSFS
jgi:hypothetical protein